MALTQKHLNDICMIGGGIQQCRYLLQDDEDYNKFCCLKLVAKKKDKINKAIDDYVADCKKKGIDPNQQQVPLGDNCKGYPLLKNVQQGYDKP